MKRKPNKLRLTLQRKENRKWWWILGGAVAGLLTVFLIIASLFKINATIENNDDLFSV